MVENFLSPAEVGPPPSGQQIRESIPHPVPCMPHVAMTPHPCCGGCVCVRVCACACVCACARVCVDGGGETLATECSWAQVAGLNGAFDAMWDTRGDCHQTPAYDEFGETKRLSSSSSLAHPGLLLVCLPALPPCLPLLLRAAFCCPRPPPPPAPPPAASGAAHDDSLSALGRWDAHVAEAALPAVPRAAGPQEDHPLHVRARPP